MRIKFILLTLVILLTSLSAHSQISCLNTLREAKELYGQGLIDEIPNLLSGCMESGFTRAQRIEAYKLIILAYLFDDNQFDAEKTMDDFLKKFPEYEVMPNDPIEFVYLLESYKTSSLYSINIYFGTNIANQRIKEPYTLLDHSNSTFSTLSGGGLQIGVGVSRSIWKSVFINLDVFYSIHNYSQSVENNIIFDDAEYPFVKVSAKEKMRKFDIPVSLSYQFGKGNLNYMGRLGGIVGFVRNTSLSLERTYPDQEIVTLSENNLDISKHRQTFYSGLLFGAGLQYKIPRGYLVLDLRYCLGLNNMVVGPERLSTPRLWSRYYYIDSDFYLDYFSINLAYYFSIYQSRKKRN